MKSILVVMFLGLIMGCAHTPPPCVSASEPPPLPKKDNFDKAAEGSRFMYDESLKAWRWMTSEEMKEKYRNGWKATKDSLHRTYDTLEDYYKDRK